MKIDYDFFNGKRIFITGHNGFKGTWLCALLSYLGAEITGYSLYPDEQGMFIRTGLDKKIKCENGDISDLERLRKVFRSAEPEIVIHMAAQPLVRNSYEAPVYTYQTNVIGTVNICECIREYGRVKSFINVTTDKVYRNTGKEDGYKETDILDGYDPYANSKSCSELITGCYCRSFFLPKNIPTSTVRAGNVIGGGDISKDRIIPDCVKAAINGTKIQLRNPLSVRPYQHVLDALYAYLLLVQMQYEDIKYAGNYNVGPQEENGTSTAMIADLFCQAWGEGMSWEAYKENGPHEDHMLKLDCGKYISCFGHMPVWDIEKAIQHTVSWEKRNYSGMNPFDNMIVEIQQFLQEILEK